MLFVGDMVLARFKNDNQWYRARVREVHPKEGPTKSVEVIYIDYGNSQKLSLDRYVVFKIVTINILHCMRRKSELLLIGEGGGGGVVM